MITSILAFALLGIFGLFTMAVIVAAIFPDESIPPLLRGPARHVRAVYDLVDELVQSVDGEVTAAPIPAASASGFMSATPEHVAVRDRVSVEERRFFLLQEISVHCKFEPQVEDGTLLVSRRNFSRLNDYCNLAFDEPMTPQQLLAKADLSLRRG